MHRSFWKQVLWLCTLWRKSAKARLKGIGSPEEAGTESLGTRDVGGRGDKGLSFCSKQGRDTPKADKVTKMATPRCSIPVTVGAHELFTRHEAATLPRFARPRAPSRARVCSLFVVESNLFSPFIVFPTLCGHATSNILLSCSMPPSYC